MARPRRRLRITSELREVIYLDQVRLLAVDHPADTTVFSRDRAAPIGIAGPQIAIGRNPRAPRSAMGSDGVDRTAMLAKEDGEFAPPGRVLPPPTVGFTEPLSIELDFGDWTHRSTRNEKQLLARAHRLVQIRQLVDKHRRLAANEFAGDLAAAGSPRCRGQWHLVDEMVGFPAGNTKTIVCDLVGQAAARYRSAAAYDVV